MTTRSAHNVRSKTFFFIESLINKQQRITGNKKSRTAVFYRVQRELRAEHGISSLRQPVAIDRLQVREAILSNLCNCQSFVNHTAPSVAVNLRINVIGHDY